MIPLLAWLVFNLDLNIRVPSFQDANEQGK